MGVMLTTPTSSIDKLTSITFDDLLREQDPFGAVQPRFDLRKVKFVSPAAMVQLAAACHSLEREGRRPEINLGGTDVHTYLMRANLINVLRPIARFNPPFDPTYLRKASRDNSRLRGKSGLLIEVTKIESGPSLRQLPSRVIDVLVAKLGYPEEAAFDAAIALSEIAQNTVHHNDEPCGFLAMQVYDSAGERWLEIGVADSGHGLAPSLRRNPEHASLANDWDAIALAVQNRTSRHAGDETHGTGLYHLMGIAQQHSGSLQIRSGRANLRLRGDQRRGWGIDVPHMPGLHIAVTLRAAACPA